MSARIDVEFDAGENGEWNETITVGVDDEMMAKLMFQFYVALAKNAHGWIRNVSRFDIRGKLREEWSC